MGTSHAKTAKPIELPFGTVSGVGPVNRVLNGRAHWPIWQIRLSDCARGYEDVCR